MYIYICIYIYIHLYVFRYIYLYFIVHTYVNKRMYNLHNIYVLRYANMKYKHRYRSIHK